MEHKPQRANYPDKTKVSQLKSSVSDKPPQTFKDKVIPALLEEGCPPYLIKYYLNWIWQYQEGQKSVDQLWDEFIQVALPLMTSHLKKNDPITRGFVKKLLQPRIDEDHHLDEFVKKLLQPRVEQDHSLDELESERRHWPLLPGCFEMGKRR